MRPWNIEEQSVEVEGTKWMLEFTSAHTEALAAGEPAPDHDQHLVLRVWNETRTRYMLLEFDRSGMVKRTSVEAAVAEEGTATDPEHVGLEAAPDHSPAVIDQGIPPSVLNPATPGPNWDNGEERPFASPVQF
jgi:hypothetical protein